MKEATPDYDVTIVGAGPVGLLLANLLARNAHSILLIEKRTSLPWHSMAIGITPPSLRILSTLGLDTDLVRLGHPIREAHVYADRGVRLGSVPFNGMGGLGDTWPFVLSVPQSVTCRLLRDRLHNDGVNPVLIEEGCEALAATQSGNMCEVEWHQMSTGQGCRATSRFVVGCDGARSVVRSWIGERGVPQAYRCRFLMGDFEGPSDLGCDAHLFFTRQGAVEAFPLPAQQRRWIVQTRPGDRPPEPGELVAAVANRTGISLDPRHQLNETQFTPARLQSVRYHDRRIILCGDAAHLMSPIGGQGMNTGFADAATLASKLGKILAGNADPELHLKEYFRIRSRASRISTRRAALGMWLGTRTGTLPTAIRNALLSHLLLRDPIRTALARHFAMLTVPGALEVSGLYA